MPLLRPVRFRNLTGLYQDRRRSPPMRSVDRVVFSVNMKRRQGRPRLRALAKEREVIPRCVKAAISTGDLPSMRSWGRQSAWGKKPRQTLSWPQDSPPSSKPLQSDPCPLEPLKKRSGNGPCSIISEDVGEGLVARRPGGRKQLRRCRTPAPPPRSASVALLSAGVGRGEVQYVRESNDGGGVARQR